MSRKRKQSKHVAPASVEPEAAPDEILAEGSGPHADVEADAEAQVEAGSVAAHVGIETGASEDLAEAAKAVGRRRKRRGKAAAPEVSTESAASGQSDEVIVDGEAGAADAIEPSGEASMSADAAVEAFNVGDDAGDDAGASFAAASANDDSDDAVDAAVEAVAGDAAVEAANSDVEAAEALDADEAAMNASGDAEMSESDTVDGVAVDLAAAGEDGALAGDEASEPGAVLPTSAASMDAAQLKHLVEALVFASDKPLTVARLRQLTRVSDTKRLEQALDSLAEDFRDRGLVLQQVSGGYQFRTRTQFSAWVQQLIAGRPVRLSRAQLETLAIIAYRQPITRPEIDDIRGVDSSATLKLLIDRTLIRILGKREEVGRPMLYGTTKEFLDFFSLGDLRELPTLREYSELTDESRRVMSDRLGIGLDETARATDGGLGDDSDGSGGSSGSDGGSDGGGSDGGGSDGGGSDGGFGGNGNGGGFIPDGGFDPNGTSNGHEVGFDAAADLNESNELAAARADEAVANEAAAGEVMADVLMADEARTDEEVMADVLMADEARTDEEVMADVLMADEARADEAGDAAVMSGSSWPDGSGGIVESPEEPLGDGATSDEVIAPLLVAEAQAERANIESEAE